MATTIYGNTLDSLMGNRVAQQEADAAERNAYRNYLNQVANTNLRRREGDSMDRYRTGDIDVRRQDVAGLNQSRVAQADIGRMNAGANSRNVDSLIRERPLDRATRERIAEIGGRSMVEASRRTDPTLEVLREDAKNQAIAAEKSVFAGMVGKLLQDYQAETQGWPFGKGWAPDSAATKAIQKLMEQTPGLSAEQAAATLAAPAFKAMYPRSLLFADELPAGDSTEAPRAPTGSAPITGVSEAVDEVNRTNSPAAYEGGYLPWLQRRTSNQ